MADSFFNGISKHALDDTLSTTVYETIESNSPNDLAVQSGIYIISDNLNDTLAGTGAQKVRLTYMDSNFNKYSEIVNMNGLVAVATSATNILHIESFEVIQVGSGKYNAGNIKAQNLLGTEYYAKILTGDNEFFSCVHHVPVGKIAYVTGIRADSFSTGVVDVRLTHEEDQTGGGKVNKIFAVTSVANYGSSNVLFESGLQVAGGNHIRLSAKAGIAGQSVHGRFDYFEVDV